MNKRAPSRYSNHNKQPGSESHGNQHYSSTSNYQTEFNSPNTPPPIQSGACVLCNTVTVLMCQRCGDFYCSPTCQQKDWQKHRYICFQIPPLVLSSARVVQNLPPLNKLVISPSSNQTPSGIVSQNRKWVNTTSPSPQVSPSIQQPKQTHQLQQLQQLHQNRSTPPKTTPKVWEQSASKPASINIGKVEQVAFPKNESAVLVTAIRSTNRVFLRSLDKEQNERYCEVMRAVNAFGKTAAKLKTMPTRNTFAITEFQNDGIYYRVQVVSAKSENEIHVVYFDFGNEEVKKLSELKEISKECAEFKQYIVAATLKDVPYIRSPNDKLKKYLKSFEDIEMKILYNEKEKPACELLIFNVDESLNQKINLFIKTISIAQAKQPQQIQEKMSTEQKIEKPVTGVKVPVSPKEPSPPVSGKSRPSQLSKPIMTPPFETITLPVNGKNLNIMVVDNSLIDFGYFSCVLSEDRANLKEIHKYLSEYVDTGRPYKPKVDEYCLAKYEGSWYRAKVISSVSSDNMEVVFIDILNEATVAVHDIRRYSMDLELPCKTSLCMIDELPNELGVELVEYLRDFLKPGSEHKINEVKRFEEHESNVVIVKMNQVTQWMAENGSS